MNFLPKTTPKFVKDPPYPICHSFLLIATQLHRLFFLFLSVLLGNRRLKRRSPWRRRQDAKFAQDPGHPLGRLCAHRDPVLQPIRLESNLLHPVSVGNGIKGTDDFQKAAVAGRLGMGGDHAVKGRMLATESL